jgi:hypothetical protein
MRAILVAALAALAAGAGMAAAAEPKLPEVKVAYAVTWNGIGLGDAIITLKNEGGPDCYRYESVTDPVGIVRMFYGKPRETSEFCVSGGRVVPRRFVFHNPGADEDSFTLEFDLAAGKVRDGHGQERDVPANAQDRFGIQQAVRLWVLARLQAKDDKAPETVEFAMVDHKRVKAYRFAITGREQIRIPAGTFDTVLVQRVDDPKKSSKFWLAPERDYMPIKVEQLRGGKADLRMVLR